jgi:hypothetical protein
MINNEAATIASNCRHYAMCKIDYLGTGLCPAIQTNQYVSYYPEGRMDIYHALANNAIPVTEGLLDVANTCTLCGICDKQCYFITELRPVKVMQALKGFVADHLQRQQPIVKIEPDNMLMQLQAIFGEKYATNDPAHLITYATDPCPIASRKMPKYVVLPRTRDEIVQIVRFCKAHDLSYIVRGNGASSMGFALGEGLVIDMNRMKDIVIDKDHWCAIVEPGVTAFELQQEATKQGLRANVAEPAATVCGNMMCSGIFSLFCASYGTCANNCVNAEFVDQDGNVFDLNQRDAPNLFSFKKGDLPMPGICTRTWVKLHPMTADEEGVLVPFADFNDALAFCEELNKRQIGIGIGMLGGEYISVFMAPTKAAAQKVKEIFPDKLGINCLVLVLGDQYAIDAVKKMTNNCVIDNALFKTLLLGLPNLIDAKWLALLDDFQSDKAAYEILCQPEIRPLVEVALAPSPKTLASVVAADLQDFFTQVYERPEMTNLMRLNMFRFLSSRMGREKQFVASIVYVPLDKKEVITAMCDQFKHIADKYNLKNHYGFIMPLDFGKRALLEYDYYLDHTNPDEIASMQKALFEAGGMIESFSVQVPGVVWIRYVVYQGFCRMENLFYI